MITEADRLAAAEALLGAYASRTPVAPLSAQHPGLDVEDAYAIQSIQIDRWRGEGRPVRGYKIGLTSEAIQRQLGVDQPDYGFLVEGTSFPDGAVLDAGAFLQPRIEPEIAVILGKPLRGPGLGVEEVADAVDRVVGALEIIDSRIADWRITLADTIADNASSAAVVVGGRQLPLAEIDVAGAGVTLLRDGEPVASGTGSAVLGSPLRAVAWLANRLGEFGVELQPGALVLPGSLTAAIEVVAGQTVSADFGALGTVSVTFSGKDEA